MVCVCPFEMKIVLILFIGGVNYAMLTPALTAGNILDEFVEHELYLGLRPYFKTTHRDCVWREPYKNRKLCTKEVKIWLNSNGFEEVIDPTNPNWLRNSKLWDKTKENVFFVHGYMVGNYSQVTLFMRDALIESGAKNVFMIDYGTVSAAPCYIQLAQNYKYVSYCLATYLKHFLNNGMNKNSITCIGHSMGAQICGLLRRYLRVRIKKIIGLDPALPLIMESIRLSWRDAKLVHTIQTNAGHYGDFGAIGHLDVCANNGIMQPFCADSERPHVCSHVYALCFMAHSLFYQNQLLEAKPCAKVCPHLSTMQITKEFVPQHQAIAYYTNGSVIQSPKTISFGMNIPDGARGSYCLSMPERPFCPTDKNKIGSKRCCDYDQLISNDYIPIFT